MTTPAAEPLKSKFCRYCQKSRTPDQMRHIKKGRAVYHKCVVCIERSAPPPHGRKHP
jgi:hypothetical protein